MNGSENDLLYRAAARNVFFCVLCTHGTTGRSEKVFILIVLIFGGVVVDGCDGSGFHALYATLHGTPLPAFEVTILVRETRQILCHFAGTNNHHILTAGFGSRSVAASLCQASVDRVEVVPV